MALQLRNNTYFNLNDDIVYRIFEHFVAIDDDGPLTLISLSTQWRDTVVASPKFWTWILIDDDIPDLNARVHVFATLSQELPLQITARRHFGSICGFQDLLKRCQVLFIHLTDNVKLYRETKEEFETLIQLLRITSTPELKHIYSYDDNGSFSRTGSLYRQLMRNDELDLQSAFAKTPPMMLTEIRLEEASFDWSLEAITTVATTKFWTLISQLPYLTVLVISMIHIPDFSSEKITNTLFPNLQELTITAQHDQDPDWSIVSCIQAPSIYSVTLGGTLENGYLFRGIKETGTHLHARRLTLRPLEVYTDISESASGPNSYEYHLIGVRSLDVAVPVGPTDEKLARWLMSEIKTIIGATQSLEYLRLHLDTKASKYLPLLPSVSCIFDLTYSMNAELRRFTEYHPNRSVKNNDTLTPSHNINKLTMVMDVHDLKKGFELIEFNKLIVTTLVIRQGSFLLETITYQSPRSWYWCSLLQDITIEVAPHFQDFQDLAKGFTLPNLTTLTCPPKVASLFIEWNWISHLRRLTLRRRGSRYDVYRETQQLFQLCFDVQVSSHLHLEILALEFYPEWSVLLQFISIYASKTEGSDLGSRLSCLQLPAKPHISILRAIVSALESMNWTEPIIPDNDADIRCDYCKRSGRDCLGQVRGEFCRLHSQESLISITKYAL